MQDPKSPLDRTIVVAYQDGLTQCKVCEIYFRPRRSGQRGIYCSPACRSKFYRDQAKLAK